MVAMMALMTPEPLTQSRHSHSEQSCKSLHGFSNRPCWNIIEPRGISTCKQSLKGPTDLGKPMTDDTRAGDARLVRTGNQKGS